MATEMPKGYKKTEVGVIPEDWEVKRLGDIFRVTRGQVLAMWKTTKDSIGESRYPVYSSQTKEDGLAGYYTDYLFEDCITWTTDGAKAGEVKFRAGKFYCTNVCGVLESKEGYSNQCIAAIFNSISRKYVSYVGNPKLMNNVVADIKIGIPKQIKEQTAIATALSDMDRLISVLEKLIAKKRNVKQGAMQALLTGKRRLPGFSGKWVDTTLGAIITRFSTGLNPRNNFRLNAGGTLFYVTIKNFLNGHLFLDEQCDLIDQVAWNLIQQRADLRKDDILFASIGRVGDAYLIKATPTNWNINESVFTLRPDKDKVEPLMLFHLLTNRMVKDALAQGVTGSTFKSIKQADLKAIPCRLPLSHDEQAAIASILTDMDDEIEVLEVRRDKIRNLKQGMMQELLTGKTRLI